MPEPELGKAPADVKSAEPEDVELWSVTTIIGALDKPALLYWAAEQTAAAAVAVADSLRTRVDEDGAAETIKWLRDARFRKPKGTLSAASLGTVVHAACEEFALAGVRPTVDQLEGFVRAEGGPSTPADVIRSEAEIVGRTLDEFDRGFLQRWSPEYVATEVTVYSPNYGYAGTADGFVVIDGVPLILDYKTSRETRDARGNLRTPYPEVALQLAAYRHAEMAAVWRPRRYEKFRRRYYLLSPAEIAAAVPVPPVDGGVVVHLTPERCGVYPIKCDADIFRAYRCVQEAARFVFTTSKNVVGSELVAAS